LRYSPPRHRAGREGQAKSHQRHACKQGVFASDNPPPPRSSIAGDGHLPH
jgi:hypothetical protein